MNNEILETARNLRIERGESFHDSLVESIYSEAAEIAKHSVSTPDSNIAFRLDKTIDRLVTSRIFGFPIMLLLLALVFWITIVGANYPSGWLATLLVDWGHPWIRSIFDTLGAPWWLTGVLVDGAYLAGAWVVSVMLHQ